MTSTTFFDADHRDRLSKALKAVRRLRGVTVAETAALMSMPLRSYEHFEAGGGRFDFAKVNRFAEALDVDPFAILVSVQIGSPRFAVRAANNKLMLALLLGLEELDRDLGEGIARLDTASIIAAFGEAWRRLSETVGEP
jgi:transcriptional regulator with XRE-family HTH domain